jgi:hypothetical protein
VSKFFAVNFRHLSANLHRDIGYFLSGLILVYCLSGIALNHVNDWNPDFVIHKQTITLDRIYTTADITAERVAEFTQLVGEVTPKVHEFPTANHVKIYYDNASLLVDLIAKTGTYERVQRRPFFYQTNVLHRNSLKGWKWASDLFGVLLIFLTMSGWFILKGKNGLSGRGKWLIAAGMLPPVVAIIIFRLIYK